MPAPRTMDYVIEKGIPLSVRKIDKTPLYPWEKMEVGDSFLVEAKKSIGNTQTSIRNSAYTFCGARKLDWKFATRRDGNKIRVWRIK